MKIILFYLTYNNILDTKVRYFLFSLNFQSWLVIIIINIKQNLQAVINAKTAAIQNAATSLCYVVMTVKLFYYYGLYVSVAVEEM